MMTNKVCFNHARGTTCGRMTRKGQCPYSHADEVIPFGAYPRNQEALAAVGDSDENLLYEASEVLTALTMMAATATPDDEAAHDPQDTDA